MKRTVADQLRELIINDRWGPGDHLPRERDLGKLLQSGRNQLREAVARLIADGILTIQPGVGTIVGNVVSAGSFELVRFILRMKLGTPRASTLLEEILWLRRMLYVSAAELLVDYQSDLEFTRKTVHEIRWGNHFGCAWNDAQRLLVMEERGLCSIMSSTWKLPAVMLANAIRRILEDLAPMAERGLELDGAHDKFLALVEAVAKRDREQIASLMEQVCRLREANYLAIIASVPSETTESAA